MLKVFVLETSHINQENQPCARQSGISVSDQCHIIGRSVGRGRVGSGRGLGRVGSVGSGRVGSGRVGRSVDRSVGRSVGSGRVGSGRVGSGRVGSGRVGSGRLGRSVGLSRTDQKSVGLQVPDRLLIVSRTFKLETSELF